MAEEIAFENGTISNFQGLVTLTSTFDQVTLHTIVHHSSTSSYVPNFIEIDQTFCRRTNVWMDEHLRPTLLGRLRTVNLKTNVYIHHSLTANIRANYSDLCIICDDA